MKRSQSAAQDVVELRARLVKLGVAATEAEHELADRKARRTTLVAEDEPVPDTLTAEIVAGSVALESTREAIEVMRERLAAAEKRAEAEAADAARRELRRAEDGLDKALRSIRPGVAALRPLLEVANAAVARVHALRAQLGQPIDRTDVVERALLGALVSEGVIDSRTLNASYAALTAGDPVEAERRAAREAAQAEADRAADEAYWNSPATIERQLEKLDREDRELRRFHATSPVWAAQQQNDINARRAALNKRLEGAREAA